MGQVLFVVWRESVEALLVIGILYAWLRQGDAAAQRGLPYLWLGVALGGLAALGLGASLVGAGNALSGDQQALFQAAMMFIACALMVQMVFWMKQHGRMLKKNMEAALEQRAERAQWWGIAILAALAVAREGSETVIFLYGLGVGQSAQMLPAELSGVLLGIALALLTFYILQLGSTVLSWRHFFFITEIVLLFLACGLLQSGLDILIGLEKIPSGPDPLWNSTGLLNNASPLGSLVSTLTGYRAQPSLTNVLVYLAYWGMIVIAAMRIKAKRK